MAGQVVRAEVCADRKEGQNPSGAGGARRRLLPRGRRPLTIAAALDRTGSAARWSRLDPAAGTAGALSRTARRRGGGSGSDFFFVL